MGNTDNDLFMLDQNLDDAQHAGRSLQAILEALVSGDMPDPMPREGIEALASLHAIELLHIAKTRQAVDKLLEENA